MKLFKGKKQKQPGGDNNSPNKNLSPSPTMEPPHQPDKPRLARRSTLHRMTPSLASYRATPITKHYALNNQILAAFEQHFENKSYPVAYAIGLQFVETAVLEIPKHGYFYSLRHATERMTNSLDAIRVSNMLQSMLEQQQTKPNGQQEFGIDLAAELGKVRKLNGLALEQAAEANLDHYEKQRAKLEAELNEMERREEGSTLLADSCGPLIDTFTETLCPGGLPTPFSTKKDEDFQQLQQYEPMQDGDDEKALPPPAPLSERGRSMSNMMRQIMIDDPSHSKKSDPPESNRSNMVATTDIETAVPPPPQLNEGWTLLPGEMPARPEFGRQMSSRTYADHVALERALYLSGLEVQAERPISDYEGSGQEVHLREGDDEWMLEHALKESEREMQKLKEQEEKELMEICKKSEREQQEFESAGFAPPAPRLERRVTKNRLETQTLHTLYHEDFVSLWNSGRIRVTHVDTFQGKLPGSVNGCTVIAPLLCIHHFINFTEPSTNGERSDDPGLPDETIKTVIDEEVPSILPKIREELGVVQGAFLIPSDSHDYLLKNQLLSQQQFVTVVGGNILDEQHLQQLVKTLEHGGPPLDKKDGSGDSGSYRESKSMVPGPIEGKNIKIACTLFFHEHVVAILKLRRSQDGKAWYDIIDSLPFKGTFSRDVGSAFAQDDLSKDENSTSFANANGDKVDFDFALADLEEPMNAARIRCLDEEALTAALRWYAWSKFNSENLNYIDNYPWDDLSTDFDPRVFQAFVWTEAT